MSWEDEIKKTPLCYSVWDVEDKHRILKYEEKLDKIIQLLSSLSFSVNRGDNQ